jgi:hypothetical protein
LHDNAGEHHHLDLEGQGSGDPELDAVIAKYKRLKQEGNEGAGSRLGIASAPADAQARHR